MSNPTDLLYDTVRAAGVDFFTSVPCKLLGDFITRLSADGTVAYTPVSREEEAVGIMAGAFMAGRRPALVMQNSGFGNSINAVLSLLNYYRIPALFLISHRGSEGEFIEAQKLMGNAIGDLLRVAGVACHDIPHPGALEQVSQGIADAWRDQRPAAFLFPFSFWTGKE